MTELLAPKEQTLEVISQAENPYANSLVVDRLAERFKNGEPLRMAWFDIDSTMTGTPEEQLKVRQELVAQGYVLAFVSSRTYEMMMSREQYDKSNLDNKRPGPKLNTDQIVDGLVIDELREKNRICTDGFPNEVTSYAGLYGSELIVDGTGTNILVQQQDGTYKRDTEFQKRMQAEVDSFRAVTEHFISIVNGESQAGARLAIIEDPEKYKNGESDVYTPDIRVQLNFDSLDDQAGFTEVFKHLQKQPALLKYLTDQGLTAENIKHLRITEDGDPAHNRFQIYVTPHYGYKARAVETAMESILEALNTQLGHNRLIKQEEIESLVAGDSFPDVNMGLFATETQMTFLLVGNSRLAPKDNETGIHMFPNKFANEKLEMKKKRMKPTQKKGIYRFKPPLRDERRIVIGADAFPNTKGPQTIYSYLESEKK